jgi:hypothetical protein
MKRRLTALTLGLFLAGLSGCGDTHDSLAKQQIATLNEMADILATVKPKLKALAEKARDLKARSDKLGKLSEEEKKKLQEKYQKDSEAATKRVLSEVQRVATVPGGPEALKDLGEVK